MKSPVVLLFLFLLTAVVIQCYSEYEEEEGSAYIPDDEDIIGSGDDLATEESLCMKERSKVLDREKLSGQQIVGAFIPKCTASGEYEPKQCHGSTGYCWCSNKLGQEIPDTKRRGNPNCYGIDRNRPVNVAPSRRPTEDEGDDDIQIAPYSTMPEESDFEMSSTVGPEVSAARELLLTKPWILVAIIAGAAFVLLCSVLCVMFIVYRMKKKDEGTYTLGNPEKALLYNGGGRQNEFFA